mmetsp:Transcript_17072/g.23454  ORF Transcript_17072/g.23454 Transcript_17072/m.23454 type:complete len:244 (-) Transcript_17072:232-963(-)
MQDMSTMSLLFKAFFISLATLQYAKALSTPNLNQMRSSEKPTIGTVQFKDTTPGLQPVENLNMDRRKVTFGMIGSLWSIGSIASYPKQANAIYGQDANIALPNVIEGMNNRVTQQCLVESLGNRECLVYLDPENKLYKGADSKVLFERVEKSSEALATIPDLIEAKKWLAVVGVLTGPMGTLVGTMNQLSKLSEDPSRLTKLANQVKTDLYAIAASADKKQGDKALQYHKEATQHLVEFVKAL